MRDPDRINNFCERLATVWHKYPDWRFGQLFLNLPFKKDPFFYEDDEMIELIESTFGKDNDNGR